MDKKFNFNRFVEKATKLYGDKYIYNEDEYMGCKHRMRIFCKEHGWFEITPDKHINGKQECPFCTKEKLLEKNKIKKKEKYKEKVSKQKEIIELKRLEKERLFKEKSQLKHDNKYIYDNFIYKTSNTKGEIICPIHGSFWQTPNNHLNGKGCPRCRGYNKTTEEFINELKQIHGDKYIYTQVNYINRETKVCIICPKHGEFWATPSNLLCGRGCPKCSGKYKTTEELIKEFREIHGDKYDYSKVDYKNATSKVCIICPTHGEFWQTPNKHLQGRGCPYCKNSHLEEIIFNKLKENSINFIKGYKPEWLHGKELDFYLPQYNIAIECQGEQHFPTELGRYKNSLFKISQKNVEDTLRRDIMKSQECKNNQVKLYYIISSSVNIGKITEQQQYQSIYNNDNIICDISYFIRAIKYDNKIVTPQISNLEICKYFADKHKELLYSSKGRIKIEYLKALFFNIFSSATNEESIKNNFIYNWQYAWENKDNYNKILYFIENIRSKLKLYKNIYICSFIVEFNKVLEQATYEEWENAFSQIKTEKRILRHKDYKILINNALNIIKNQRNNLLT